MLNSRRKGHKSTEIKLLSLIVNLGQLGMLKMQKKPNIELSVSEKSLLSKLTSPAKVQAFLDSIAYSSDPFYRCPRSVMRDKKAHCFDGAVFAVCALEYSGQTAQLIDLRAVHDDDHVLAVFKKGTCFGAIGKSNFVGLRYRDPIYRSLRELVMSYFEAYFNLQREKTLRSYSTLIGVRNFEKFCWRTNDSAMEKIAQSLDAARHFDLMNLSQVKTLLPVDERSLKAGTVGINMKGVYKGRA